MKNKITVIIFSVLLFAFSLFNIVIPSRGFSVSERRELAKFPEISVEKVFNGSFMSGFEKYATDNVLFRDYLRGVKANFSLNVLNKKDNNSLFFVDGHVSKIEYPEKNDMMLFAANKFNTIYEKFLTGKDIEIYLSVVPDKNYYLAEKNGYLSLDYKAFIEKFYSMCKFGEYIDITKLLDINSYYTTDSHWKMEKIVPVAEFLLKSMGQSYGATYEENTLDNPFYGVFAGQSALKVKADTIKYLTNKTLKDAVVTYFDTGKGVVGDLYNMKKAFGNDPYEMFLSGSTPLCTIENPNAQTEDELILFRDSFGSSIAPLLLEGYSKITVVDIRYIQSDFLGSFINFENQDVLFLYSTMLLNNSLSLR